ncbi:MAG: NYN domain-containing protein [Patescibacteria group bacterium]|nr:NYN domain-containing protein [Patescibacteria group bacterium]MDE2015215.1 NYN domain-containing protein [Patescibacteria group bacterium]MDE2226642.1 NYN domain-containing protein [Patescibacteria group bacterium]
MSLRERFFGGEKNTVPQDVNKSAPETTINFIPTVIALVDYENIAREAAADGKIVDFAGLAELCRSCGKVAASFLFVPDHMTQDRWVREAYDQGFFVVSSPSRASLTVSVKQADTADTNMISIGRRFSDIIDGVVIVSNDRDFLTLVNDFKDKGKKIVLIHGAKVSPALREVVKLRFPVPVRNR